jgi:hypothetical protein
VTTEDVYVEIIFDVCYQYSKQKMENFFMYELLMRTFRILSPLMKENGYYKCDKRSNNNKAIPGKFPRRPKRGSTESSGEDSNLLHSAEIDMLLENARVIQNHLYK